MINTFKNITLMSAVCFGVCTTVHADYEADVKSPSTLDYSQSRYNAAENFAGDECCTQASSCGNGFISADFLYLRACQNGLDYCFSTDYTIETIGGTTFYNFNTDIKEPNYKWKPGYRVAAGWQFADSHWNVVGVYTHFQSNSSANAGAQYLRWNLDFNVLDVLFGNRFYETCNLSLNFFGGVKFAEVDQKTRSFRVSDFLGITKADRNKQNFFGLGPVIGVNLNYQIGKGFSIFADGAVAALYGHNHIRTHNTLTTVDEVRTQHSKNKSCAYQGVIDADVGIQWDTCVFNKQTFVKLGGELHRYFSYNRLGDHDDLCIDGVRLAAGFNF